MVGQLGHHPHSARVGRRGLPDRAGQSELVERGWPQVVNQTPDIGHCRLSVDLQLLEQRLSAFGIAREQGARRAGLQRLGGESRTEAVVKVAPEPSALLLERRYKPLARTLKLFCDDDRVDGRGGLARQIRE